MNKSYDELDINTILYDEIADHLDALPDQCQFEIEALSALEDQADNYPYIAHRDWPALISDMWNLYMKDQHNG